MIGVYFLHCTGELPNKAVRLEQTLCLWLATTVQVLRRQQISTGAPELLLTVARRKEWDESG